MDSFLRIKIFNGVVRGKKVRSMYQILLCLFRILIPSYKMQVAEYFHFFGTKLKDMKISISKKSIIIPITNRFLLHIYLNICSSELFIF